jgi:hypothetical protein
LLSVLILGGRPGIRGLWRLAFLGVLIRRRNLKIISFFAYDFAMIAFTFHRIYPLLASLLSVIYSAIAIKNLTLNYKC